MIISNWSVRPSGGKMTIDGKRADGTTVKLRNVTRIESGRVPSLIFGSRLVVQAVLATGARHTLV